MRCRVAAVVACIAFVGVSAGVAYAIPDASHPALEADATVAGQPASDAERARLDEVARTLDRHLEEDGWTSASPEAAPFSYGWQLFRTAVFLLVICLAAYLILGKILPRLMGLSATGRRGMIAAPPRGLLEVVDRLAVDSRRSLLLVRAGENFFLIATGDQPTSVLARLDDPSIEASAREPPQKNTILGRFASMLNQKSNPEG